MLKGLTSITKPKLKSILKIFQTFNLVKSGPNNAHFVYKIYIFNSRVVAFRTLSRVRLVMHE